MSLPRILVVDDQLARSDAERLVFLTNAGLTVKEAIGTNKPYADAVFCAGQRREERRIYNDYSVVCDMVKASNWALVLLDVQFDSGDLDANDVPTGQAGDNQFGMTLCRNLKVDFPDLPVVMLTSKRHEEIGEADVPFLSKHKLGAYEMRRALLRHGDITFAQSRMLLRLGDEVCANDPATLAVFRTAFIYAGSKASILILGESGTGKEVMASQVHSMSARAAGPYIAVNVAAIPNGLVESELFGHKRGAFTGANAERVGRFEQADGGTLFLDEIGDMPLETQSKVLRALEMREITRVGEVKPIPIDIRLVCATSRDLAAMTRAGEFRSDLLHRINTVPITMPPLRERPSDVVPMARRFLDKFAAEQKIIGVSFSADALALLETQPFQGNVRELKNLIERLAIAAGHHQVIGRSHVLEALQSRPEHGAEIRQSQKIVTTTRPIAELGRGEKIPTLDELADWLEFVPVDKDDPALKGIKPRLEKAFHVLLQRLGGAALERCRDPMTREHNRQKAMQLLTGDPTLKHKGPVRTVNELLGRNQEHAVEDADLERLVEALNSAVNLKLEQ